MAVARAPVGADAGVRCFRLNSVQATLLSTFYETALGFRRTSLEHLPGTRMQHLSSVGGRGIRITLELGQQRLKLLQYVDHPGRAYPMDSTSADLVFQHLAIVVADMDAAMQQLSRADGWSPISPDGPQQLPKSSGGVTAFKFRDPEGHPLELLQFPADDTPAHWQHRSRTSPFLGIDHSAISVSDSASSVAFYESLGLAVSNRSLNEGAAQARLDHVKMPVVEVTALAPPVSTPHMELLCYRHPEGCKPLVLAANDVAATCVVFGAAGKPTGIDATRCRPLRQLTDPDGHHLAIEQDDA